MTSRGLLAMAFTFFALNALTQGLVSGTADLDQAQQLVLSQDLRLGYGTQPPLYTWVIHTLFRVTGASIWTLFVFKVLLLTLLVGGAIRVGQRLGLDDARLSLAILGFALLPQIVWESQRDLTHSLLATVCAMWTLAVFLRLRERPEPMGYVHMGLCIGLGLLGKYNYAFFLVALVLVALSFPDMRRVVLAKTSVVSAALALAMVLPHAIWVFGHHATATASVGKLGLDTAGGTGLLGLGNAAFQFAFPLLVAWLASARGRAQGSASTDFLTRLLLVVAMLLGLFVIVSGATQIKDRWLQPLLFFLPFLVVLTTVLRARVYAGLAIALMLLVAISLPGRSLLADVTGSPQRPNLPYASLAENLRVQTGAPGWIVSDRELLAGNMRLAFPDARVDVVRDMAEFSRLERPADAKIAVFVSDDPRRGGPPGELAMALAARGAGGLRRSEAPMRHMAGMRHTLYWLPL